MKNTTFLQYFIKLLLLKENKGETITITTITTLFHLPTSLDLKNMIYYKKWPNLFEGVYLKIYK